MMRRLGTAQRGGFGKNKLNIVLGRVGKAIGTCSKKPHILF
jgi:hypothetical protein